VFCTPSVAHCWEPHLAVLLFWPLVIVCFSYSVAVGQWPRVALLTEAAVSCLHFWYCRRNCTYSCFCWNRQQVHEFGTHVLCILVGRIEPELHFTEVDDTFHNCRGLLFRKCMVWMLAGMPANPAQVFHGFLHSIQANAVIVPEITPCPHLPHSIQIIHWSLLPLARIDPNSLAFRTLDHHR
jgi:hypothetical protein